MMIRRVAVLALFVLAAVTPLAADCIANGHYTIVGSASPLRGTLFPYTEDLVHHSYDAPFGDSMTVAFHEDRHWVKIQSGCASFEERNIHTAGPTNLLLRASLRFGRITGVQPDPQTRFEVQLRVGTSPDDPAPRIVATELRRLGGRYPQSYRFAGTLQDLPAGSYVYSLWFRFLDGDEATKVVIGLQWITAQGAPSSYASTRAVTDVKEISPEWTPVGEELVVDSKTMLDLSLQSSFVVASGDADVLMFGWSTDGAPIDERYGVIAMPAYLPVGETIFDHRGLFPMRQHTVRLWARTGTGQARLERIVTELVSFPSRAKSLDVIPVQEAMATEPMEFRTSGDEVQPAAMSAVCGRWTKILEFDMEPSAGSPSWTIDGFVELLGVEPGGYAQVGVETVHEEPDLADPTKIANMATDVGMFEMQVVPGRQGIFFYGDCSKWGNFKKGNHISLWIRRIEGCNDQPFGGDMTIGRRWVAIKLLPSPGPHLP